MSTSGIDYLTIPYTALSSIQQTSYIQLTTARNAWVTFQAVELYNSNISTSRANADPIALKTLNYYQYRNLTEKTLYESGASLMYYYYGFSNTVQKN